VYRQHDQFSFRTEDLVNTAEDYHRIKRAPERFLGPRRSSDGKVRRGHNILTNMGRWDRSTRQQCAKRLAQDYDDECKLWYKSCPLTAILLCDERQRGICLQHYLRQQPSVVATMSAIAQFGIDNGVDRDQLFRVLVPLEETISASMPPPVSTGQNRPGPYTTKGKGKGGKHK
jgi:hypothetical protein